MAERLRDAGRVVVADTPAALAEKVEVEQARQLRVEQASLEDAFVALTGKTPPRPPVP